MCFDKIMENSENKLYTMVAPDTMVSKELVALLLAYGEKVRLVGTVPCTIPGTSSVIIDFLNHEQVESALKGSAIVYLMTCFFDDQDKSGHYLMAVLNNVITGCRNTGAKLIYIDTIAVYGRLDSVMTEDTPFSPIDYRGKMAVLATSMIQREIASGILKCAIVRTLDFYGPCQSGYHNHTRKVFLSLRRRLPARWPLNADMPHAMHYLPDMVRALYIVTVHERAMGSTWHLPTDRPALTGRQFITLAARYLNAGKDLRVIPKWLLQVQAWFNVSNKRMLERSYQYEFPIRFDSSKFENAFHFKTTSYQDGIKATAEWEWLRHSKSVYQYQDSRSV